MEVAQQTYPKFKYTPLKHARSIRLIQVHLSPEPGDPLEISFLHTHLDRPDRYQTLSYTWHQFSINGYNPPQDILCAGRALRISSNLHSFLLRLRSKLSAGGQLINLPIWIDALCINQRDVSERDQQVSMMAEIYKRSYHLMIWLGDFDLPIGIGSSSVQVKRHRSNERKTFNKLVQLRWFRRRWVIQEVLNGCRRRSMWIGEREMDFDSFVNAARNAQLAKQSIPPTLEFFMDSRMTDNFKRTLVENLWFWDRTECGDPRDRIYALLSISKDRENFDVSYAKDVEATYCQVAATMVESQNMDTLSAMLVCAICRSRKAPRSWRAPRSRPAPQWRKPLRKDQKAFKEQVALTQHELKSFKARNDMTAIDLTTLELEKAMRTILPSWVPDWRVSRRLITPEEQECVDACFAKGSDSRVPKAAEVTAQVQEQYVRWGSLQKRYQYLSLRGWLFPGCQCALNSSKPYCDGCHTRTPSTVEAQEPDASDKQLDDEDLMCWCSDCWTPTLEECNILRKNKRRPRMIGEQTLCLVKNSTIAYVLSPHESDEMAGKSVYQLDTCFLVHPVLGDGIAETQLGEPQEIVLA